MLAGMQAHDQSTYAVQVLLVVTIASTVADYLWFWGGRRYGRRVLSLLCKLAISPDSCVRQNHISFARYGVATLVIAKFVPGLSRSEEHTSELKSLMRISYDDFCLTKKTII